MKYKIKNCCTLLIITSAVVLLAGCGSIDQGPFQNFAASAGKVNSSAKDAYDLLAKTGAAREQQKLVESSLPPYTPPTNRAILLGKTFVSSESIEERIKVTSGLMTYAQALANLVSEPAQKQFDTSTAGLADALKQFDSSSALTLFKLDTSKALPSAGQIDAFTGAVQMIGNAILEAETKSDVLKLLNKYSPAISCVTTNLENDIGYDLKDVSTIRNYIYRDFDRTAMDEYDQITWTTDEGKTLTWTNLSRADREKMVADAVDLVNRWQTTDAMLVALRDSYGKFRTAHEALKGVVEASQEFSLSSALSSFNQAAQQLDDIVNSLKKPKATK